MSSYLPIAGPLINAGFNYLGTRARRRGATQAASEIEKYNRQNIDFLLARGQQGRDDLLNQSALGRENLEPYIDVGHSAIDTLGNEVISGALNRPFSLADFQREPGYEFRLTQGERPITAGAAAGYNVFSPGTTKALMNYNQDYASNEYGKASDRFVASQAMRANQLSSLASGGLNASGTAAQMYQNTGQALLGYGLDVADRYGNYMNNIGYGNASARLASGAAQGDLYQSLGGDVNDALSAGLDWWQQRQLNRSPYNAPGITDLRQLGARRGSIYGTGGPMSAPAPFEYPTYDPFRRG